MASLFLRNRCHICGAKDGLTTCLVCGKKACLIHIVDGKCQTCFEKEALGAGPPGQVAKTVEDRSVGPEKNADLKTDVRFHADPLKMLADLYLLLGGRPGTTRSTTPMGYLHLDQARRILMYDRQVARRINLTTLVRVVSTDQAEVESPRPPYPKGRTLPDYIQERARIRDVTTRVAHDQVVQMLDLVSLALSGEHLQVVGGDHPLEKIVLNDEMACPFCGSWREVCQCPNKPEGNMDGMDYFRSATRSRLKRMKAAARMARDGRLKELEAKIHSWSLALESYQ